MPIKSPSQQLTVVANNDALNLKNEEAEEKSHSNLAASKDMILNKIVSTEGAEQKSENRVEEDIELKRIFMQSRKKNLLQSKSKYGQTTAKNNAWIQGEIKRLHNTTADNVVELKKNTKPKAKTRNAGKMWSSMDERVAEDSEKLSKLPQEKRPGVKLAFVEGDNKI